MPAVIIFLIYIIMTHLEELKQKFNSGAFNKNLKGVIVSIKKAMTPNMLIARVQFANTHTEGIAYYEEPEGFKEGQQVEFQPSGVQSANEDKTKGLLSGYIFPL